jgi:disulfide bond formation protein DsbB
MAQRYPYAAIIVIGSLSAVLIKAPRLLWLIAIGCCLLLALDAAIAFYHAGVELGFFPGPSACTSNSSGGETLEEMRREIMNAPLVPCNQPMLQVLGISMAGWNAIAASLLFVASVLILVKRKRA